MTRMIDRPVAAPQMRRSQRDVLVQQLHAIDLFSKERAAAQLTEHAVGQSRESRMDLERRLEVLRRQHQAIIAQTEAQLKMSVAVLRNEVEPRIVIAHRNEWFVSKVTGVLAQEGVRVAALVENGADAVGAALAEQPELVLVEEKLAMVPGEQVVRDIRRYCPDTAVAAQVGYSDSVGALLEAGARAVLTRQVPPPEVASRLLQLLAI
jgi:CheY-like chemotaxis protein